jgi:hypothetical protein
MAAKISITAALAGSDTACTIATIMARWAESVGTVETAASTSFSKHFLLLKAGR